MDRPSLAVVIPCHNEAATLEAVLRRATGHGALLVVDDRSSDSSAQIARDCGAQVLASAQPGYDGALETGLRRAFEDGYRFVVTMDADGEHDPEVLADFDRAFQDGAELVCGYRRRPQRAAEYVVARLTNARFQIRDLLCGMKGYSRPVLERFFASGLPLSVNMAPALLWRRLGGDHAQVKVTGTLRADAPRFGRALHANWAILREFNAAMTATRLAARRTERTP
jgi:glycosyltransferase involved in cell wall biosynthesis